MQKRSTCQSAFLNSRTLIVLLLSSIKTGAIHIALLCAAALSVHAGAIALVKPAVPSDGTWTVTGSLNTGRFRVHGGACCPMAWCLSQVDLIATTTFWRAPNSTIRRAGAEVHLAASTPLAQITPPRCCPTAWCLWPAGVDSSGYSSTKRGTVCRSRERELDCHGQPQQRSRRSHGDLAAQRYVACCRWSGQRRRSSKRRC